MNAQTHHKPLRHPLQRDSHPTYMRMVTVTLLAASLMGRAGANATNEAQAKKKRPPEVVITGTVFTENGFSLGGATIRVNRVGERKSRWETTSDRRGEFAVRVPQGTEYEVRVKTKGYKEQTQKVDGRSGTYENLVFRMTPATGGKKP